MSINQKEIVVPEGYMQDRKGRLVPIAQVSDYDLEMDAFVRSQVSSAEELHQHLKNSRAKLSIMPMPVLICWLKNMTASRVV